MHMGWDWLPSAWGVSCCYRGTTMGNNLAHTYSTHFGHPGHLLPGDPVMVSVSLVIGRSQCMRNLFLLTGDDKYDKIKKNRRCGQ